MHNIHTYMCACLALEATSCRTAPASAPVPPPQFCRQFDTWPASSHVPPPDPIRPVPPTTMREAPRRCHCELGARTGVCGYHGYPRSRIAGGREGVHWSHAAVGSGCMRASLLSARRLRLPPQPAGALQPAPGSKRAAQHTKSGADKEQRML